MVNGLALDPVLLNAYTTEYFFPRVDPVVVPVLEARGEYRVAPNLAQGSSIQAGSTSITHIQGGWDTTFQAEANAVDAARKAEAAGRDLSDETIDSLERRAIRGQACQEGARAVSEHAGNKQSGKKFNGPPRDGTRAVGERADTTKLVSTFANNAGIVPTEV